MLRWIVGACALVAFAASASAGADAPATSDPDLRRAIRLVTDGEYAAGLAAIDASLPRLRKASDRAVAQLYAGVALIARGQAGAGKERFKKALADDPGLVIGADAFPPKVTQAFAAAKAERAAAQRPAEPGLRLLGSTSGASGATRGPKFVIDDPRSSFEVPADKQAVVSFEWQAPTGTYRLRGTWRDPRGARVTQPELEVTSSGGHMTAYWTLALPESAARGQWTLEISEDGQAVGQHVIQVAGPPSEPPSAASADLFALVAPALAVVERRDGDGKTFGRGLGFFVAPDLLATAFQVVEGARSLRILAGDGRVVVSDRLRSWSRWQDWAIVEVPGASQPTLRISKTAAPSAPHCRVIDLDGEDKPYLGRTVTLATMRPSELAGERLRIGAVGGVTQSGFRVLLPREAAGGPVVDERGAVVGILGGSLAPGESAADGRLALEAATATPIASATLPESGGSSLGELIASGESLPPTKHGELARVVLGKAATEETSELSRADRALLVSAAWTRIDKKRPAARVRVYALTGTLLAEGEPVPGSEAGPASSAWRVDVSSLPAGVHRLDVVLEADVVWRAYYRLSE